MRNTSSTPPRRLHRWISALALGLALCLATGLAVLACTHEEPVEQDDRVTVKITLDPVVYVEDAIPPRKLVERIKSETKSAFRALRRADVLLLSNQQVDVESRLIHKDQVTVVDPGAERGREVARVRFHFVALAQVPKALADRSAIDLGVLHSAGETRREAVLAECSESRSRDRPAGSDPWALFDATLPSCASAIAREQAAIDAARQALAHPDHEIVPAELTRAYLPLVAHLQRRHAPDAGDDSSPGRRPRFEGAWVGPGSSAAPAATGPQPDFIYIGREDAQGEEGEDEKELRRQARALGGDLEGPREGPPVLASSAYLAPNYAILYLAVIACVVLLVGKTRYRSEEE
jgi:hypothetical protein